MGLADLFLKVTLAEAVKVKQITARLVFQVGVELRRHQFLTVIHKDLLIPE